MTIETRITFPEGGTECPPPPEESTVVSPTAGSFSNNNANSEGDITSCQANEGDESKLKVFGRKRKKGRKPKRVVLETPSVKSKESSKPDKSSSGAAKPEAGASTSASIKSERTDDLKKSKVKNQNESSKVDNAASRKSMRLLLRRGRGDNNYSGFLWPKDRPRYVEDLKVPLDFEDEKTKIMFMDTLGLFPRCKTPKIETVPENKCSISSHVHEDIKLLNNESGKPNVNDKLSDNVVNEKEKLVQVELTDSTVNSVHAPETVRDRSSKTSENPVSMKGTAPLCADLPSSHCIAEAVGDSDDDGGWEIWIHRIPPMLLYSQGTNNESPSQSEINESLNRLTQLGTDVVLVSASGI
ncbi:unnamed protein product [Orchesella dallaii]|uniref:Uncharacterized protein n=1 Tax=Orchesella dallaii TaxID=48710 RepID=A0ABP1RCN0_9HEXA